MAKKNQIFKSNYCCICISEYVTFKRFMPLTFCLKLYITQHRYHFGNSFGLMLVLTCCQMECILFAEFFWCYFLCFPKNFGFLLATRLRSLTIYKKKRKTLNSSHNGTEIKVQTAEQQTLGFSLNTSICK